MSSPQQEEEEAASQEVVVAALYKFAKLPDYESLREPLLEKMISENVRGTLLLAKEGINGTVAGSRLAIDNLLEFIRKDERLKDVDHKESLCEEQPFFRAKVRLKKEIVTLGVPEVDPTDTVGTYLDPKQWNELIQDPNTVLIDTRNDYEVEIGTFKNALNPNTKTFREFPSYVQDNLVSKGAVDKEKQNVAMFCTGGIRCEKSTAYMLQQGFKNVYHLKGGILKYLEETPKEESLWEGECFVFDRRVAVNHDLQPGVYSMCRACRVPLHPDDLESDKYELGVSCPKCYDVLSQDQKDRFAERIKQVKLAEERGIQHVGGVSDASSTSAPKPFYANFNLHEY